MKRFIKGHRKETYLLPPSMDDWLFADHPARFLDELIDRFDLSAFEAVYQGKDKRGGAAYEPAMMLKILIYCYCTGRFSSRKIEAATWDDLAVRFLSGGLHPDHDSIAYFRARHAGRFSLVFREILNVSSRMRLTTLGHVSIDGTKIPANAARRKTVKVDELAKKIELHEQIVADLLRKAEEADRQDEEELKRLPKELADRQQRLALMKKALEELRREQDQTKPSLSVEQVRRAKEQQAREEAAQPTDFSDCPLFANSSAPLSEPIRENCEPAIRTSNLRSAREERGLTQAELSRLTGIARLRILRLEKGIQKPKPAEIEALSEALGVPANHLFPDQTASQKRKRRTATSELRKSHGPRLRTNQQWAADNPGL